MMRVSTATYIMVVDALVRPVGDTRPFQAERPPLMGKCHAEYREELGQACIGACNVLDLESQYPAEGSQVRASSPSKPSACSASFFIPSLSCRRSDEKKQDRPYELTRMTRHVMHAIHAACI